jgi:hypothetical protein
MVGVGLFLLGLTVGLALAAVVRGVWPVAVVVVIRLRLTFRNLLPLGDKGQ